ncbi:hypothetical protein ACFORG_13380 [Lutimaribacter marinistellae]|uniref:Uncharacterized protein n=1 Tax=Lutimaribacter marinistellae TaxID=1820329 RepID=A0ABV7TGS3_9RHOB
MIDNGKSTNKPTGALVEEWSYRSDWSLEEAALLALAVSPEASEADDLLRANAALLGGAKRSGDRFGAPLFWLWWGESNALPFHEDWWLAITPQGPIGYDGRHFAFNRAEIFSEDYRTQERALIGKWARKPYWTSREAVDLSLNFAPYSTQGWRGESPETSDTIREREDRFRILERALELEAITEQASPLDWLNWLGARGYYVSAAWKRAVGIEPLIIGRVGDHWVEKLVEENAELHRRLDQQSALVAEVEGRQQDGRETARARDKEIAGLRAKIKELSEDPESPSAKGTQAKRIASLEKALLAAAVDGYSYDPRQAKSDVPAQIAAKAGELGTGLTSQTVRKYLKESADNHVDQGVWEQIHPRKQG